MVALFFLRKKDLMAYIYTILYVPSGSNGLSYYRWPKKSQAVGFLNSLPWGDSEELDTQQLRGFALHIGLQIPKPAYRAEFEVIRVKDI